VSQFLAGRGIFVMDYPPCSDLIPADFWLFLKLQSVLKGKPFLDVVNIESSVKKANIPVHYYENCFEEWPKNWELCKIMASDEHEISNFWNMFLSCSTIQSCLTLLLVEDPKSLLAYPFRLR
jgi:hypothetical protein